MSEYDDSTRNALPFIICDYFWLENQSLTETDQTWYEAPVEKFQELLQHPTLDLYQKTISSFGSVSNKSPEVQNYEALLAYLRIGFINEEISKNISENYDPNNIFLLGYDKHNALNLSLVEYINQEDYDKKGRDIEESEGEEDEGEDIEDFIVDEEEEEAEAESEAETESDAKSKGSSSEEENGESEYETGTEDEEAIEEVPKEKKGTFKLPTGRQVYYVKGRGYVPADDSLKKAYILYYTWLFAKTKFPQLTTLLQQVEEYFSPVAEGSEGSGSEEGSEGSSAEEGSKGSGEESDQDYVPRAPVKKTVKRRELPKRSRKTVLTDEQLKEALEGQDEANKWVKKKVRGTKRPVVDETKRAESERKKEETKEAKEKELEAQKVEALNTIANYVTQTQTNLNQANEIVEDLKKKPNSTQKDQKKLKAKQNQQKTIQTFLGKIQEEYLNLLTSNNLTSIQIQRFIKRTKKSYESANSALKNMIPEGK